MPPHVDNKDPAQGMAQPFSQMHHGPNSISNTAIVRPMPNIRNTNPCCVMVLRNMVDPGDVDDELEEEVGEECRNYGIVKKVYVHEQCEDDVKIVKIFVHFNDEVEVEKACRALNGRFFDGKVVKAEKYPQERFNCKDYSG